jgi:hypothetical protein
MSRVPEHLEALLVDRALFGLDVGDERELELHGDRSSDELGAELEAAAAAVALALADYEPMPDNVRNKIESQSPVGGSASATHAERLELVGDPRDPEPPVVHRGPAVWFGWAAAAACAGIAAVGWLRAVQIGEERDQYAGLFAEAQTDFENLTVRAEQLDEQLATARGTLAVSEAALASTELERESLAKQLTIAEESRDDFETRLFAATASVAELEQRVNAESQRVRTLEAALESLETERDGLTMQLARFTDEPGQDALRESRAALLNDPETITFDWGDWSEPEIAGVRGDVVWNEAEHAGFMRFVGLPVNDPQAERYQLWLVDDRGLTHEDGRSARVSGGVFDVEPGDIDPATGEVLVPIRVDPGQRLNNTAVFAVTIEGPRGQPASDMSRRVVIATGG